MNAQQQQEQESTVLSEAIKAMEDWRDRLPPSSYWINAFDSIANEVASCLPGYEADDDEEDDD